MSPNRPLTIGLGVLLVLGAAASGAAAQDSSTVDVSALALAGSRQFFVEDLSGAELKNLNLGTTGQGQLFQTRVADSSYTGTSATFTVGMEMTKLYQVDTSPDGINHSVNVPSEKLSVSFAGVPTDVAGVSLGAVPQIQVAGLLPKCDELTTLLSGNTTTLLAGGLLSTAAQPLCTALGGLAAAAPVTVETTDGVLVTLDERVLTPAAGVAPLGVTGTTESGNFPSPSYLGDGAGDTSKPSPVPPATTRRLLAGEPTDISATLQGLMSAAVDTLPLFPAVPGGTGALTTVGGVVSALQSSPDLAVAAVGNALAGLSAEDQTDILSAMDPTGTATSVATLATSTLKRITGTYRSFPRLVADLASAAPGEYTGTMTVTFVQE